MLQKLELNTESREPVGLKGFTLPSVLYQSLYNLLFVAGQSLALSPQLFSAPDSSTLWVTIAMVLFGCFLAFMISVAEFLLLSHTSSLTLSISGIFKVSLGPGIWGQEGGGGGDVKWCYSNTKFYNYGEALP